MQSRCNTYVYLLGNFLRIAQFDILAFVAWSSNKAQARGFNIIRTSSIWRFPNSWKCSHQYRVLPTHRRRTREEGKTRRNVAPIVGLMIISIETSNFVMSSVDRVKNWSLLRSSDDSRYSSVADEAFLCANFWQMLCLNGQPLSPPRGAFERKHQLKGNSPRPVPSVHDLPCSYCSSRKRETHRLAFMHTWTTVGGRLLPPPWSTTTWTLAMPQHPLVNMYL